MRFPMPRTLPGRRHEDVEHGGVEVVGKRPRQFVAAAHDQESSFEQRVKTAHATASSAIGSVAGRGAREGAG
jgi:hypothetical protein